MPVPTQVTDLSATIASNSPAGSDNVFPDLDNYLRALSGFLASIRDNSGNGWVSPYATKASPVLTGVISNALGTAALPSYTFTGDLNTGAWSPSADAYAISTAGAERFRLDASGNLGLGVTPSAWGTQPAIQQLGGALWGVNAANYEILQNAFYNGTNYIYRNTNLASRYNQNAGVHSWFTAPSGTAGNAITFTQAMTLDASGNLLVGSATPSGGGERLFVSASLNGTAQRIYNYSATTPQGLFIYYPSVAPNSTTSQFLTCGDSGATRAEIRSNGGLANFSANNVNLSDVRTKTDIQPATSYLDKICAIPVKTFLYKDQTDTERNLGVIAQDVEAVAPELIDHSGFGNPPEGESPYLAVYQTDLQYALMKCIQEQQALITSLTARVAALEA